MESRVKLSKDGTSIDFTQSDSLPTSLKKFRQSPEIEGFYRFIFENDLQKEAFEILEKIIQQRKAKRESKTTKMAAPAKAEKVAAKPKASPAKVAAAKPTTPVKAISKAVAKPAPKTAAAKHVPTKSAGKAKPAAKKGKGKR